MTRPLSCSTACVPVLACAAAAALTACARPVPTLAAEAAANPSAVDPASLRRGREALTRYQCGACHAIPGVATASAPWGPSLAAWGRRSYIAGHLPNDEARLAAWIGAPGAWAPGTLMPDLGVPAATARDMAHYLLWLK